MKEPVVRFTNGTMLPFSHLTVEQLIHLPNVPNETRDHDFQLRYARILLQEKLGVT